MNTQVATNGKVQKKELTEVELNKKEAWGAVGLAIYNGEMQLQAEAQKLIQSIVQPAGIADIPAAERQLKELRSGQKGIRNKRMVITGELLEVTSRLMNPEKSLDEPIKTLEKNTISLKQEHERIENVKRFKADEVRQIIERIKSMLAAKDYEFRSDIAVKVAASYEWALTKDIEPGDKVKEYISKCINKVGILDFEIKKPDFILKYILPEELDIIMEENWLTNPKTYVNIFTHEVNMKFSDYSAAYQNKVAALAHTKKEEQEKQDQLRSQHDNAQIAAKIEGASVAMEISGPEIRALKKTYAVDMPETVESVLVIMAAFSANLRPCLAKLKVNKWFGFTPGQAAIALAKLKSDDNNFQPAGLIFKEVDKL